MTATILTKRAISVFALCVSFTTPLAHATGTDWQMATEHAGWSARHSHRSVVYQDKMWVLGGCRGPLKFNDVWCSTGGTNWTLVTSNAPWCERYVFGLVVYDGKMWVMGGSGSASLSGFGDVWSSTDGTNWTLVTSEAPWPPRSRFGCLVYENEMWVMGGIRQGSLSSYNDVWRSTDGTNWTQVTAAAGWSERQAFTAVVYDGKMWVMGGNDHNSFAHLSNDVWYSTDGTNWSQATGSANWSPRDNHASVVYDGGMWVMAGRKPEDANDVWYSADGTNWTMATACAAWTNRCVPSLITNRGLMWLLGGRAMTEENSRRDVWYTGKESSVPAPPLDVQASDGEHTNKVEITWSSSVDATKYTVYRNTINSSSAAVDVSGEISTTRYDDISVTPGQLYYYWVEAGNTNGWSDFSDSDTGYAGTLTAEPVVWPTFLDFSTSAVTKFIYCGNNGCGTYTFDAAVTEGGTWLSLAPTSGAVSIENVALAATVSRSSLTEGVYQGLITVSPSVGDAFAVTARVEVTAENTVVAEANGPYSVDQGTPVTFTAVGSQGSCLSYRWEVVPDFITSYSSDHFDYTYTNTFVPAQYDVILTVRDTNSPPNTGSDSTLLTVNNVAPQVDAGGPYQGTTTNAVLFTAAVSDPGIFDTHEYRWDFDGDSTWDTSWTNLNTASHTYTGAGNYVAKCAARDNYGAEGQDTASVYIDAENQPPVANAVIFGTTLTETNLPGLGHVVTLDGSGSYDPDTKPNSTLYFDWREDVNNPLKPVLDETNRHDEVVTTAPLTEPGEYKFHLVVFDGEYLSEPATVTARVPGWEGQVICEGFAGKVPLWGVEVYVTNTYSGHLDADRTDDQGEFLVDSGAGYQVAQLVRRANTKAVSITIDADGEYTENIYFLPGYHIYAGQIVTGFPGQYVGLPYAQTEILIGNGISAQADAAGAFGYGMIPESWPLDGEEYKVRVQKEGCRSMIREVRLNMDKNSEMIALEPSQGNVQLDGAVVSEVSGLPVAGVALDFGNSWTASTDSNGNYGPVEIPEGSYVVRLSKQGFTDTLQELSNLSTGQTSIDLVIDGGEVSVYGQIYDSEGTPVTNATVAVTDSQTARLGKRAVAQGEDAVPATGAGYYDVTMAKGSRTYIVSSPDFGSVEVTLDVNAHTKQDIILPIPEAGLLWIVGLVLLAMLRRRNK